MSKTTDTPAAATEAPATPAFVEAVWSGPAGCALNGVELVPGVTTCLIPAGEATASANWTPKEN